MAFFLPRILVYQKLWRPRSSFKIGKLLTRAPFQTEFFIYRLCYINSFYERPYHISIKSICWSNMIISSAQIGSIIQFDLFECSPSWTIQNMFNPMTPFPCRSITDHVTLLWWFPGYRMIVWRWNKSNVNSNKVNYWWKIQGRKEYESMNRPHGSGRTEYPSRCFVLFSILGFTLLHVRKMGPEFSHIETWIAHFVGTDLKQTAC